MNIPNIPAMSEPFVNKDGKITEIWYNVLNQLFIQLQSNVSQEGYKMPQQSADNIAALNTEKSTGAIVYNADLQKFMANINGVFKELVTG